MLPGVDELPLFSIAWVDALWKSNISFPFCVIIYFAHSLRTKFKPYFFLSRPYIQGYPNFVATYGRGYPGFAPSYSYQFPGTWNFKYLWLAYSKKRKAMKLQLNEAEKYFKRGPFCDDLFSPILRYTRDSFQYQFWCNILKVLGCRIFILKNTCIPYGVNWYWLFENNTLFFLKIDDAMHCSWFCLYRKCSVFFPLLLIGVHISYYMKRQFLSRQAAAECFPPCLFHIPFSSSLCSCQPGCI